MDINTLCTTGTLPSGIRVLFIDQGEHVSVFYSEWWVTNVGFDYEDRPDLVQSFHLIEHLVNQYTSGKYPNSLHNAYNLNRRGIQYNAVTNVRYCKYFASGLLKYWSFYADLLWHAINEFQFDWSVLETERHAVVQELLLIKNNPWHLFEDYVSKVMFKRASVEQCIRAVHQLTPSMLQSIYSRFYKLKHFVLVLCGNISEMRKFLPQVDLRVHGPKIYKPRMYTLQNSFTVADLRTPGQYIIHVPFVSQVRIQIVFPLYFQEFDLVRVCGLKCLAYILSNSTESRLFQVLRSHFGFTYGVHQTIHPAHGYTSIRLSVRALDLSKVMNHIRHEIESICNYGITNTELYIDFMNHIITKYQFTNLDHSPQQLAENYAKKFVFTNHIQTRKKTLQIYRSLTAHEVNRLASEIFQWKHAYVFIAKPEVTSTDKNHRQKNLCG